jgi:hypothetical protein
MCRPWEGQSHRIAPTGLWEMFNMFVDTIFNSLFGVSFISGNYFLPFMKNAETVVYLPRKVFWITMKTAAVFRRLVPCFTGAYDGFTTASHGISQKTYPHYKPDPVKGQGRKNYDAGISQSVQY